MKEQTTTGNPIISYSETEYRHKGVCITAKIIQAHRICRATNRIQTGYAEV